ncbi:MAG: hypothetical protein HQK50_15635 [Oligoflexia bacterium]|nr:hypothetical protein [Oligoflexia bacterium]
MMPMRKQTSYARPFPYFFLGLLLLFLPMLFLMAAEKNDSDAKCAPIPDQCDPAKSPGLKESGEVRVGAMRKCLSLLAVKPPPMLYHYAPRAAIERMLRSSQEEYNTFSRTIQSTREELGAFHIILKALQGKPHLPKEILEQALQLHASNKDLEALAETCRPFKGNPEAEKLLFACTSASFLKVYPGLEKHYLHYMAKEEMIPKKIFEEELQLVLGEKPVDKKKQEQLEGTLLGYELFNPNASPKDIFRSTAGLGIYYASTPSEAIAHANPATSSGVACTPLKKHHKGKKLIDSSDPCVAKALTNAGILISQKAAEGAATIYRPQGRNIYISPQDAENAMQDHYILSFPVPLMAGGGKDVPPYYVDKGVIDYAKQCRPINISDFQNCYDFQKLLSGAAHPGWKPEWIHNPSEALFDRPIPDFISLQENFSSDFFNIANACLGNCKKQSEKYSLQFLLFFFSQDSNNQCELRSQGCHSLNKINTLIGKCGCKLHKRTEANPAALFKGKYTITCKHEQEVEAPKCEVQDLEKNLKDLADIKNTLPAILLFLENN